MKKLILIMLLQLMLIILNLSSVKLNKWEAQQLQIEFRWCNTCCTIKISTKFLEITWNNINCKDGLKPKWAKHCVLATGGVDNTNNHSNYILFTVKGKVFLAARQKTKIRNAFANNKSKYIKLSKAQLTKNNSIWWISS